MLILVAIVINPPERQGFYDKSEMRLEIYNNMWMSLLICIIEPILTNITIYYSN